MNLEQTMNRDYKSTPSWQLMGFKSPLEYNYRRTYDTIVPTELDELFLEEDNKEVADD